MYSCALEEFHYYYYCYCYYYFYYYYYYNHKGFDNLKRSNRHFGKFLIFTLGKCIQGYAFTSEGCYVSCPVSNLFSTQA